MSILTLLNRTIAILMDLTWPAKFFAVALTFFAPLASLIYVIVFLLIVDAITSIYYQMKMAGRGLPTVRQRFKASTQVIESGKLRRTLEKMFFYFLMIIVFYTFDVYVIKVKPVSAAEIHTFSITNLAAVLICMVELTSIASNVSKITANPVFDRIVKLFQKKVDKKFEIDEDHENK